MDFNEDEVLLNRLFRSVERGYSASVAVDNPWALSG